MKIVHVTPENVMMETLFCSKDPKTEAFKCKQEWFEKRYKEGLMISILKNDEGKPLAFIEYVPIEYAWRPVEGENYMFIHCTYVYAKKDRSRGLARMMLKACEEDATKQNMNGVCVMTSDGVWMADSRLFENSGYVKVDELGRFELMLKKFIPEAKNPRLINWQENLSSYQGWHLLYGDQCPWHEKSARALNHVAKEYDIDLHISKISSAQEAKKAPSGFGVYNLVHDGKVLADHYISATRFHNILKKELKLA